ncbi:MAG: prefoldin subunit [Nanoarchaeota archaeon]|nr:prefoldin subunit [Nanoarchaeota archaeon]
MDQEKIQQMQFLEQNLQSVIMQKQAFQMEISEAVAALKEVENSKEDVFKIVGQLMIKTSTEKVVEDLKKKEKILQTRLEALEKQEETLAEQSEKLRNELIGSQKKVDKVE